MSGSFLQYTTSSFVYCVIAAENLCLINAMLPELLMSCQFTVISLFFHKIIGLRDIGGQMCAHDDGVDGWESLPHTLSPSNHCFIHCHNLHCTSLLHPAILLYTVWARKQQTVQQRVRSGWVTFIVFILTSARFTPSSNASSLHGTCLFFVLFFLLQR